MKFLRSPIFEYNGTENADEWGDFRSFLLYIRMLTGREQS